METETKYDLYDETDNLIGTFPTFDSAVEMAKSKVNVYVLSDFNKDGIWYLWNKRFQDFTKRKTFYEFMIRERK